VFCLSTFKDAVDVTSYVCCSLRRRKTFLKYTSTFEGDVASRRVRPPIAPVGVSFARLLEGRGELLLCKELTNGRWYHSDCRRPNSNHQDIRSLSTLRAPGSFRGTVETELIWTEDFGVKRKPAHRMTAFRTFWLDTIMQEALMQLQALNGEVGNSMCPSSREGDDAN
jgi:hypothetical protein